MGERERTWVYVHVCVRARFASPRCMFSVILSMGRAQVKMLSHADIYVALWGGDTIQGLHMPFGGSIIEVSISGLGAEVTISGLLMPFRELDHRG